MADISSHKSSLLSLRIYVMIFVGGKYRVLNREQINYPQQDPTCPWLHPDFLKFL